MGLQAAPAFIGAGSYNTPVETDRNLTEQIFGAGAGRSGLVRPGAFKVAPTATARQVSVTSGGIILFGTENSTQGAYLMWSDGTDTYTFAAAVGNPRIDTLVARVVDTQYGVDAGGSNAYVEIVQGVAAASPTARADSYFNSGGGAYRPGAWYRLADVRINVVDGVLPAGQITETLQYVRIAGWTLCTSTTRPSDPQIGDRIYETDTKLQYAYDGTSWRPMAGQWIDGVVNTAGDTSQAAGNNAIMASRSFTAVAGTRYRVVYQSTFRFTNSSSSSLLALKHVSGGSITTGATSFRAREIWSTVTSDHQPLTMEGTFVATASGTYTVGFSSNFFSGTGTLFHGANTSSEQAIDIFAA